MAVPPRYRGGNDDFWLLNELDNRDKHRVLLVLQPVASPPVVASGQLSLLPGPGIVPLTMGDPFIGPGGESYFGSATIAAEDHENLNLQPDVAFNEPGILEGEPAVQVLLDFRDLVKRTLKSLSNPAIW